MEFPVDPIQLSKKAGIEEGVSVLGRNEVTFFSSWIFAVKIYILQSGRMSGDVDLFLSNTGQNFFPVSCNPYWLGVSWMRANWKANIFCLLPISKFQAAEGNSWELNVNFWTILSTFSITKRRLKSKIDRIPSMETTKVTLFNCRVKL